MDFIENSVCECIILKPRLSAFGNSLSYCDFDLCGKKVLDWVKECVSQYNVTEIECEENLKSEVSFIQPFLKNAKYTIVIYANMPLVYTDTINNLVKYTNLKDLTIAKSGKINIYKTEYIKNNIPISNDFQEVGEADLVQFTQCKDYDSYCKICKIMQSNIIENHLSKGVKIENPFSVVIDANSHLGQNVTIKSNCVLLNANIDNDSIVGENCILKNAFIGKNVEIKQGNIIEKTKINDNCFIDVKNTIINSVIDSNSRCVNSKIENSRIDKNCIIKDFCIISSTFLGANIECGEYVRMTERKLKEGAKINPFCNL